MVIMVIVCHLTIFFGSRAFFIYIISPAKTSFTLGIMYAKASGLWSLDNMQKQIAKAATQDVHKTSQAQAAVALDRQ
jgi:hypothetical protein